MSGTATIDLRIPVGGLLAVLGAILAAFGYLTRDNAALYAPAGNLNINLAWGLVMVAAGMLFLLLAFRAARRERREPEPPAAKAREVVPGAGAHPR